MTKEEEEARAKLNAVHTSILDAFRLAIPKMRTSALLAIAIRPEDSPAIDEIFNDKAFENLSGDAEATLAVMAAMLAVMDEFDRRMPVPK